VVVGDAAPAHQRGDHRQIEGLRQFHQQVCGIGIDDAAAADDQRALGGIEHRDGLLCLLARGGGLVDWQGLVGVDVELDLGQLHIDGQVNQHRAGAAGAHHVEGLLEHARHQRRFANGNRPFGHRLGNGFDIDGLEIFLVQLGTRRLTGDAEDRD